MELPRAASGACRCGAADDRAADDRTVALLVLLAGWSLRASVDERSGLLTYDAWRARAAPVLARPRGAGEHCALLLVDIDRFKAVNDTHGHLAGDAVIRAVAGAVRREAGPPHLAGRFGGDEFVVLLDRLRDHQDAVAVAERITAAVRRLTVVVDAPSGPAAVGGLSVSVGAASADVHGGASLAGLLWSADTALYAAKRAGRDRPVRPREPSSRRAAVPAGRVAPD